MRKVVFIFCLFVMPTLSFATEVSQTKCNYIQPPTNQIELLQNLLCITKDSINIEAGYFINDEQLWRLTGGQSFYRQYPIKSDWEESFITKFPSYLDLNSAKGGDSLSIDLMRAKNPHRLHIRVHQNNGMKLGFEDVEKLLGNDWQHQSFTPTETAHMGQRNNGFKHSLDKLEFWYPISADRKARILVDFSEKGTVAVIDIKLEDGLLRTPVLPWVKGNFKGKI